MDTVFLFERPSKSYLDGQKVALYLRLRKLRQKNVAELLHVSPAQFCQILNARYSITPERLANLCALLHVPPHLILKKDSKNG